MAARFHQRMGGGRLFEREGLVDHRFDLALFDHRQRVVLALASWMAVVPMPDEPPCTRKLSPLLRPPRSTMLCQTVKKVSGTAAASTIDSPPTGSAWLSCVRQYSA